MGFDDNPANVAMAMKTRQCCGRLSAAGRRIVIAALLTVASATGGARAETLAITDVTVLPMTQTPRIERATVIIRDGVIERVGPARSARIPRAARRIDGTGKFLMPGLSDMHAHLIPLNGNIPDHLLDLSGRVALLSYLTTGVTVLRDASGTPVHLSLRARQQRGEIVAPRLSVASPITEGRNAVWQFAGRIAEPSQADPLVAKAKADGYEWLKVYHTLSGPAYRAVMAASRRHRLPVIGHVPFDIGIEGALTSGQYSIEHLRGYDFDGLTQQQLLKDGGRSAERMGSMARMSAARMATLAQKTRKSGTWNVPTLAVAQWLSDRDKRAATMADPAWSLLLPQVQRDFAGGGSIDAIFPEPTRIAMREAFPAQVRFVRALYDARASLLIGTDTTAPYLVRGFTPIDEMKLFAQSGIPALDILRIATVNAAKSLRIAGLTGTVVRGSKTDLILLSADPVRDLDNLWALEAVISQGSFHTRDALIREISSLNAQVRAAQ